MAIKLGSEFFFHNVLKKAQTKSNAAFPSLERALDGEVETYPHTSFILPLGDVLQQRRTGTLPPCCDVITHMKEDTKGRTATKSVTKIQGFSATKNGNIFLFYYKTINHIAPQKIKWASCFLP